MPILWLAPGDDEQPHRPVCGLHAAEDRPATFRVSAAAERIHRSATQPGGEDMGDDDEKFGPWVMAGFWLAALVASWALLMVTLKSLVRLAALVGLLSLVLVVPVGAQTFTATKERPPVCLVCPPPTKPPTVKPFDLWIRGVNFNARAVVQDGAKVYVLVYAAQFPAAALVDVSTGLAQIAYPFDAGIGPDPAHPGEVIRFDDVTVLTPRSFLWWHRGASWAATWDDSLRWQPMPGWVWR